MTETGTSDDALAAQIGVDRTTVSRIRRGTRLPSADLMRRISDATAGAVMANDFIHAAGEAA